MKRQKRTRKVVNELHGAEGRTSMLTAASPPLIVSRMEAEGSTSDGSIMPTTLPMSQLSERALKATASRLAAPCHPRPHHHQLHLNTQPMLTHTLLPQLCLLAVVTSVQTGLKCHLMPRYHQTRKPLPRRYGVKA